MRKLPTLPSNTVAIDCEFSTAYKEEYKSKITFLEGDLCKITPSLQKNSFDIIVCSSVLEHLENPVEIISQAYSLLKEGGKFIFDVPSWFAKPILELLVYKLGFGGNEVFCSLNEHKHYFSKKDIWLLLVKSGFLGSNIKIWKHKFFTCTMGTAIKNSTKIS